MLLLLLTADMLYRHIIYCCIVFVAALSSVAEEDCGGDLTAGDMEFLTSPGYPRSVAEKDSTYPADLGCKWSYTGAEDTLVGMKFLDMKVQAGDGGSNESCEYDYVKITIDSIDGRRYCGYKKHPDAIVGLGSVEIVFQTDGAHNFRGFKLAYKITPEFDPCKDNMCQQGECVSDDGIKAHCDCEAGFTGTLCESDIAECDSDPCQNNGTCDDSAMLDHYACDCPFEFYGDNCENAKVPVCDDSPCENGGTCTDLPLFEYECECAEFFLGVNCSIETGCMSPGLPNTDDSKRFHRGTKLKFNCREGFEMEGDNETVCLDDDSWSSPVPDCKDENEDEDGEDEDSKISQTFIISIAVLGSVFIIYSAFFFVWMKIRGPWVTWRDSVEMLDNNKDDEDEITCVRNIQSVSGSARFSSVEFLSVKEE